MDPPLTAVTNGDAVGDAMDRIDPHAVGRFRRSKAVIEAGTEFRYPGVVV